MKRVITNLMHVREMSNNSDHPRQKIRCILTKCRAWMIPKRYGIAILLSLLLIIDSWEAHNIFLTLRNIMFRKVNDTHYYPTAKHWTNQDFDRLELASEVLTFLLAIPGSLLIMRFSAYRFLLVSSLVWNVLHILTPFCLQYHLSLLIAVVLAQTLITLQIRVAVLSVWKEWAPSNERSTLILFSFYGYFVFTACPPLHKFLSPLWTNSGNYFYAGSTGLLWSIVWFVYVSEKPALDSCVPENELQILELTEIEDQLTYRDVPWKAILSSKPVFAMCLLYMKFGISHLVMVGGGFNFASEDSPRITKVFLILIYLSVVIVSPASAILLDYLTRRFHGRVTYIRKCFICVGLFFQAMVVFRFIAETDVVEAAIHCLAYSIFFIYLPAILSLPLDLSPQYVSIIAGISLMCSSLGMSVIQEFQSFLSYSEHVYMYLVEGMISLFAAVVFWYYGSAEEQQWLSARTRNTRLNILHTLPRQEVEKNLKFEAISSL